MQIDVSWIREEYNALIRVAEGLLDMIRRGQACNVLTFARMAEEARAAARRIASAIERMLTEKPEPQKRRGLLGRVVNALVCELWPVRPHYAKWEIRLLWHIPKRLPIHLP